MLNTMKLEGWNEGDGYGFVVVVGRKTKMGGNTVMEARLFW